MINVSNEFIETMKSRTDFKSYAEITFSDGETLTLDSSNFISGGNSLVDGAGSSSFPLGTAIEKYVKLEILNDEEQYKGYNFLGAKIRKYLDFQLSDTIERIEKGTYTIVTPETYGETVIITAYDDMYKADKDYYTGLSFPQTAGAVLRDICDTCDITLGSLTFLHDDFIINDKPTGTFRAVIGYIAMIACGNARIDVRNRLQIISYDFDYTDGNYYTLSNWTAPKIEYNDSIVTGFKTVIKGDTSAEDTEVIAGTDAYMITIENPLISGREQTVLSWLLERIGSVPFRPFSGDLVSNPLIEFMDLVQLKDRRGYVYNSFITDINFVITGYTTVKNAAPSMEKYSMVYLGESAKTAINLRGLVEKEKTNRELALEDLENQLARASGVYTTVETQLDGSKIYYLHNKPSLDESDMVWKMTAEAWGVSTSRDDSGNFIWNAGMTVDGDTIVRILSAVGVNADWLNVGAITVKDDSGDVIFSVDMDTKNVIISGNSVRIGGKTATTAINDVLAESKDYSDGKLADYANSVTQITDNLQSQIDGSIETFFYDYEPSLQNIPASEWTTTEERKRHEGDLFYWKSKGYAYRFFQDGATWKWQLVQDTDITQAMAAAEKAQDTADGKRRVFVVTPQPPYDIGDLWTDGTDILTCAVARAAGSAYVSSDWQKLNKYTDDTVANEALEEARKARNLNIILDNEYQGIPTDYDGNYTAFPTCQTFVQVLYGQTDVSASCTYSVAKSEGVTGSWNGTTRIYTVTGFSTDTGWVDITASYLSLFTATKRFNISKVKGGSPGAQGTDGRGIKSTTTAYQAGTSGVDIPTGTWVSTPPSVEADQYLWTRTIITYTDDTTSTSYSIGKMGANGAAGRTYFMEPSTLIVKRGQDNSMAPNYITLSAYYRDGADTARTEYAGRFKIEESLDGDTWTTVYTSSADETSITHSLYAALATSSGGAISTASGKTIGIPRDVVALRCTLYAAGGTTQMLDMQSVAVVVDVDALTHEEIFNLLTNNGAVKGIYQEGDQLYISFTYAKGGTLTLGGVSNGNGTLKILNSSGVQIGKWDNTGLTATTGTFSGTLSGAKGTFAGSLSAATGTFKGTVTAGTIEASTIKSYDDFNSGIENSGGEQRFYWAGSKFGTLSPESDILQDPTTGAETETKYLYYTCSIMAQQYYNYSDERLKNISEWNDNYDDFLMEVQPICYTWKDGNDPRMHTGIGAIATKALMEAKGITNSGLVFGSEERTYGVNYQDLHAIEIAFMQKNRRLITDLQNEINSLKEKLAALEEV